MHVKIDFPVLYFYVSQTEPIRLIVQAGGAFPVSEWLQHSVRIAHVLSVTAPAADYRQPAAGMDRSEEARDDVPEPEHLGAGQQQCGLCG